MTTFQARIMNPNGGPLEATNINFTMTYRSHDGACTLFVESFNNINMAGSKGLISLQLGSGVKVYPTTPTTLQNIFDNAPTTPHRCLQPSNPSVDIGTYSSMTVASSRVLLVQFDDHSGTGVQNVAGITINASPYAWFSKIAGLSHDSEKFGGLLPSNFLKWTDMQASSCSPGQFLTYDASGTPKFTCSTPSVSSFSAMTSSDVSNALTYTPMRGSNNLSEITDMAVARSRLGLGTAATLGTGVGGDLSGVLPNPNVALVGGKTAVEVANTVDVVSAATANNTSSTLVLRDSSGNFQAGRVGVGAIELFDNARTNKITLKAPAAGVTTHTLTFPASVGGNGYVLTTNASGDLSWASPNFSSLTSADVVGALTYIPLAPSAAFSGDVTGTYNNTSVTRIRGVFVDATASTPASGDVLRFDGTKYIAAAIPSAPVASVAGRTGVVTLTSADITGLGTAAGMNVGTTTGTVAAGNDARFSDGRAPIGAASGDLTGTYPDPQLKATGVSSGTYGAVNETLVVTVDTKGRITSVSSTDITITKSQVTNLVSDLSAINTSLANKQPLNTNLTTIAALTPSGGQVLK